MEQKIVSLKEALAELTVPDSGTRERIEYIALEDIQPDPRNFYELSGLDELAGNIELFGLQQPLRVRDDPTDPDKVILVSGHRRRAAIEKLVEEGREDLRQIPCIREREAGSEALQELRLIFANSDTRRVTPAEKLREAERVQDLLCVLKKEGYPFPKGRMRDLVAAACNISKSKLSRLKVIRDRLVPGLLAYWERGDLNESVAYELARLPVADQRLILGSALWHPGNYTASDVNIWRDTLNAIRQTPCPGLNGDPQCLHAERRFRECLSAGPAQYFCARYCCQDCPRLTRCQTSCPLVEDARRARLENEAREEQAREAEVRRIEEKDRETRRAATEALTARWSRVREAVSLSGLDPEEAARALGQIEPDEDLEDCDHFCSLLAGRDPELSDPDPILPYRFADDDLTALCHAADLLGVSLDYLLGRTDEPGGRLDGSPAWQTGDPPKDGQYWVRLKCEGVTFTSSLQGEWLQGRWLYGIDDEAFEVTGWWPLPEV